MDMIVGLVDSYGYGALIGGVAAYHLFPDFVGGKNEAMRKGGLENGRKMIELAMKTRGSSPFIAGDLSLADLYLAPILFYVSLTPDKDAVFDVAGFADWWTQIQAFRASRTRNRTSADGPRPRGAIGRYIALSRVTDRSRTRFPVAGALRRHRPAGL